jgi:putative ABC transport system permease protein
MSYLIIAIRQLRRQFGYHAITITGLSVSMAVCLMIAMYVQYERSYDRHFPEAETIFRIQLNDEVVVTPVAMAPRMARDLPSVTSVARLYHVGIFSPVAVRVGENLFDEPTFMFADSTIFRVFGLELASGNPDMALVRPQTVVLSHDHAKRYFGDEEALGKTIRTDSGHDYEVTGVLKPLPATSHLKLDILASFTSTTWATRDWWSSANFDTYVKTVPGTDVMTLQKDVDAMMDRVRGETSIWERMVPVVMPLTDIRLRFEGAQTYIRVFTAIGVLLLLIASINYMNLATARATRRAKEVGIRKSTGATFKDLVIQFYVEASLICGISIVLGLLLVELATPLFVQVSGIDVTGGIWRQPWLIGFSIVLAMIVTIVSGGYPAFVLSRFDPVLVLKGTMPSHIGGTRFRQILVISQFTVSIILTVGSVAVYQQLEFMKEKDLGFDATSILTLPIGDPNVRQVWPTLKIAMSMHSGVRSVTAMNSLPGFQLGTYGLIADGLDMPVGGFVQIQGVAADPDVIATLGHELLAGSAYANMENYSYVVNESTVKVMGLTPEDAIGRRMGVSEGRMGVITGVVRDFHYLSMHEAIGPLAYFPESDFNYLLVKLGPGDQSDALAHIESQWNSIVPHRPFEYRFLDDALDSLYATEDRLGKLFVVFTVLALFVGCIGLFGLASFSASQRTKEIGVRKVLGARIPDIMMMLSREYVILVGLAVLLAIYPSYWMVDRWLTQFTYRMEFGYTVFVFATVIALTLAILAVSSQSMKAALSNPSDSLRQD